jgi:hypothetical protein
MLTEAIPDSVSSLQLELEVLVLEKKVLSGSMPPSLFNISQLQALYGEQNNISTYSWK